MALQPQAFALIAMDYAQAAQASGAGLGLAIVNEYARLLGAKVELQTEHPTGLRVSLVFVLA